MNETEDIKHKFGCEMESFRNDSVFRKDTVDVNYKSQTYVGTKLFFFNQSHKVDSIFNIYKQLIDGNFYGIAKS